MVLSFASELFLTLENVGNVLNQSAVIRVLALESKANKVRIHLDVTVEDISTVSSPANPPPPAGTIADYPSPTAPIRDRSRRPAERAPDPQPWDHRPT